MIFGVPFSLHQRGQPSWLRDSSKDIWLACFEGDSSNL